MFRTLSIVAIILWYFLPLKAISADVEDLDQAKTLSAAEGKPILLEFFRED